ncbi:MAG: exosortase U [Planctomycetaceae bacterium]
MTQQVAQAVDPSARSAQPGKTRVGYWLLVVIAGTVFTQVVTKQSEEVKPPGPERGDLALSRDSLPQQIDEWINTGFEVQSPEQLPQGQFWWTHRWNYANGALNSTVTLDQANFKHWHDLAVCYQALGWTVTHRRVADGQSQTEDWPCIVAQMKKNETESAMLVFSLFFDDGDPVNARDYETTVPTGRDLGQLVESRFGDKPRRTSSVASVRQCQVLVPYEGSLDNETESRIVTLHLKTREIFRDKWVKHWRALQP